MHGMRPEIPGPTKGELMGHKKNRKKERKQAQRKLLKKSLDFAATYSVKAANLNEMLSSPVLFPPTSAKKP